MLQTIFGWILDWAAKKLAALITGVQEAQKRHDERVAQAEKDAKKVEGLKPDSPSKDIDDAIDDELDHL